MSGTSSVTWSPVVSDTFQRADSITAGTNGNPVAACISYLSGLGYGTTGTNAGISGTNSGQWVAGTTNLTNAIASFQAAGVTLVQIALGTNDVRTPNGLAPQSHTANIKSIVGALRVAGFQVIINHCNWTMPNAGSVAGGLWPNDPNTVYEAYFKGDVAGVVDNVNVFAGDTAGYAYSQQARTGFSSDGIHPANAAANNLLGQLWAIAIARRLLEPASGVSGPAPRWEHY